MHQARVDRRAWLKLLLAGGAGLAAGWYPSLVSAASRAEREADAAILGRDLFGQELLNSQVVRFSKDWLESYSCHCTADHLHAGVDFEAPDGSPVLAVTSGFALNVKIGLGAVTVLTSDFRYRYGFNRGVTIVYFHLQNIQIQVAEHVARGAHLGDVMNIGGPDGTPFLHVEVRKGFQVEPTGCNDCARLTGCSTCAGRTHTADITLDPLAYLV
jgi:murein DD-endopeptidase MepM/ murein hydrolase activator NlpD